MYGTLLLEPLANHFFVNLFTDLFDNLFADLLFADLLFTNLLFANLLFTNLLFADLLFADANLLFTKLLIKAYTKNQVEWEQIDKKMVWNVVKHLAKETFDEQAAKYVEVSNVLLTLAGDGTWSHRRNANHGVYSIVDTSNNRLSCQQTRVLQSGKEVMVVDGNYEGTSKGMEAEGFQRAIDWLEEKKLLPQLRTYVCDQDSSVLKILNEDARLTNVKIVHDPGHLKNNFQKDLQKILGKSQKGKKYSAK
ncbi:hypothetical protein QOT17_018029 [Balamuthia mandrillaris]